MRTVIPIGGSVRLVPVAEIARGLRMSGDQVFDLLRRLKVPAMVEYGPELVINLAALEAAIFRDTWIMGDREPEAIRLYQLQAAIDYGVLDRAALQKKLRQFTAEMYNIHVRHDPEDDIIAEDDEVVHYNPEGETAQRFQDEARTDARARKKRDRTESG